MTQFPCSKYRSLAATYREQVPNASDAEIQTFMIGAVQQSPEWATLTSEQRQQVVDAIHADVNC
ncbi:hypothetical protein [Nocardia terpenica]|uniref:Uncharacterized protein n=1 Tax=Nocardia terpenica TaxID=455432 RepID=A0A164H1P6_9NOCA|nr:hypothetical protein [Nocardia terpenica]KZM68128.1 hypothetical protein AWN90_09305 [Nocardia terpenica]NQE89014.1 hypothetical protein [Nocardia terpenica]